MVKHNALILPSAITLYYARNMQYRVIREIYQLRVKCGQIYKICTFYALSNFGPVTQIQAIRV